MLKVATVTEFRFRGSSQFYVLDGWCRRTGEGTSWMYDRCRRYDLESTPSLDLTDAYWRISDHLVTMGTEGASE